MSSTDLDIYEVEQRLASAIVELRSALHELEQFWTEAHEAGRDHRWRALGVACHEQAAVLEELDGFLGNGCPGGPQPSPRGELQVEMGKG
jgi:hypothetical protein